MRSGGRYHVHTKPKSEKYPNGRVDLRPVEETQLSRWLEARGITLYTFHKRVGICYKSLQWWARGQMIPTLVHAARIEQATSGGVPIVSWLATSMAKEHYRILLEKCER